jgi:hypothetical protein
MYDSTTGRFISVDPSGFKSGETNLYRYAGNNPVNATDPSGLQPAQAQPSMPRTQLEWTQLLIKLMNEANREEQARQQQPKPEKPRMPRADEFIGLRVEPATVGRHEWKETGGFQQPYVWKLNPPASKKGGSVIQRVERLLIIEYPDGQFEWRPDKFFEMWNVPSEQYTTVTQDNYAVVVTDDAVSYKYYVRATAWYFDGLVNPASKENPRFTPRNLKELEQQKHLTENKRKQPEVDWDATSEGQFNEWLQSKNYRHTAPIPHNINVFWERKGGFTEINLDATGDLPKRPPQKMPKQ